MLERKKEEERGGEGEGGGNEGGESEGGDGIESMVEYIITHPL